MKANLRVPWEDFTFDEYEQVRSPATGATWVPSPKVGQTISWVKTVDTNRPSSPFQEAHVQPADPDNRVVSLNAPIVEHAEHKSSPASCDETRFGFAGPTNCIFSLTVPVASQNGEKHPSASFEVEFDAEQPDRILVNLSDLDEDGFVHTIQRSIPFPARLLAELLSRRRATAEETAAWHLPADDEQG